MNPQITEKAKKIIEEKAWEYSQFDQAASACMDGMRIALTDPELLKAQGLCNEWVRVEDRLPTKEDADEMGYVHTLHVSWDGKEWIRDGILWDKIPNVHFDFKFWARAMPLPTPPNT